MSVSVVIPLGPGDAHKGNLFRVAESVGDQMDMPDQVCIVADGPGAWLSVDQQDLVAALAGVPVLFVDANKFERGQMMTRNIGVQRLSEHGMATELIWFLDSDVMVEPLALAQMCEARFCCVSRPLVVAGPYEWLPPGYGLRDPRIKNAPWWNTVGSIGEGQHRYSRSAALCNLSGNLLWEWDAFIDVGGFHSELKRGEDGELGLRAAAHGIETLFVEARGWHLWHPVNERGVGEANAVDLPKIDAWHPWVKADTDDACRDVEPGIEWVSSVTGETVRSIEAWDYYRSLPDPVVKERWVKR